MHSNGSAGPTVGLVIDHYLRAGLVKLGARRRQETPRYLKLLEKWLQTDKLMADCKPLDLVLWVESHPEWKSDWTRRNVLATVQRCFNWAQKLGLCANPFWGVSQPPGDPGEPVDDTTFRRLLRNSDPPFRRVLLFLRMTGARPGEMSAAEFSMWDRPRKVLVLTKHKTSHKVRRPRIIALPAPVERMFAWIQRNKIPQQEKIFVNQLGNPWNWRSLAFKFWRLRQKLRLKKGVKLYGLRHAFATRAARNGVELKTLAELLGHASTRMSEHYVHLAGNVEHLHEAMKKLF